MMRNSLSWVLIVVLLLSYSHALDWQAQGQFTPDNMTIIWDYINSKFISANPPIINQADLTAEIERFSTFLNNKWDPAWNVVLAYIFTSGQNKDSVLYGYAYKQHWMWYNGIKSPKNHYFSIIIWKDYNCMGYKTFNPQANSMAQSDRTTIANIITSQGSDYSDIWKTAKNIADLVEASLKGRAYSVIVSQSSGAYFLGTCCVGGYMSRQGVYYSAATGSKGSVLIMQMR